MNCPFCGAPVNSKTVLHKCTHCGSSIFYGLEGYSKSHAESELQAEAMRERLRREELAMEDQKQLFNAPEYKEGIVKKQKKGNFHAVMEAVGMAAVYSFIFTAITYPLIYFLVQPRLLRSYSVETLTTGSYLFYFLFGLATFYLTSRSLENS